ncbi:hypothetical protein PIB30_047052 [Stylosanthes scabra]|uniref:RRM domain-containing protein n=1 Tax=Stylosanthes scabra TaxID=79078 RepID=A0ABU6TIL2_9FABA|nr:hypothetical protein [Stylosanthes scabra]
MKSRIFGWVGNVIDVYISRKRRRRAKVPFTFVRFNSKGEAERAIQKMNGVSIGTKKMVVKLASFGRLKHDRGLGSKEHVGTRFKKGSEGNDKKQQ